MNIEWMDLETKITMDNGVVNKVEILVGEETVDVTDVLKKYISGLM
jgi:hypothetical protein